MNSLEALETFEVGQRYAFTIRHPGSKNHTEYEGVYLGQVFDPDSHEPKERFLLDNHITYRTPLDLVMTAQVVKP